MAYNPTPVSSTIPADDVDAGLVRMVGESTFQCSFTDVSASAMVTSDMTLRKQGTGVGVSQSASNLVITTGTTTNQEFLARSIMTWKGAWNAKMKTILSQRIANQNFAMVLADKIGESCTVVCNSATSISVTLDAHGFTAYNVGQYMFIGAFGTIAGVPGRYAIASIPDANTINFTVSGFPASGTGICDLFGWNHAKILYTGTTATNALYDLQRRGWSSGDTTLTINTTASPGHVIQMQNDIRQNFVGDFLVASSGAFNVSARGSRVENIPDDSVELYLYIWSFNGTTAPASTTTWTIGFWAVEQYVKTPVYLAGNMLNGTQHALPVAFQSTPTVSISSISAGANLIGDVSLQARAGSTGAASKSHLVAAATTNPTVVKASAGRLLAYRITNLSTSFRHVKLHNSASAPTAGSGVVETISIPPSSTIFGGLDCIGSAFTTGIAFTTTTGYADADTAAVTAGDLIIDMFYT